MYTASSVFQSAILIWGIWCTTMKLLCNQTHLVKWCGCYWGWKLIFGWYLCRWMKSIEWVCHVTFSNCLFWSVIFKKCLRYVPFLITLRFLKLMKWKKNIRNTVVGLVGCRADVYQSIHSQEVKVWWETFRNAKSGSSKLLFKLRLKRSW